MKETLFGCSFSEIWVSPKDWKTTTSKKSLKKSWYVQCYFYDPLFKDKFPNGKPYRKKLNKFNTLEKRRAAALYFIKTIPETFLEGFNPITGKYMALPKNTEPEKLSPETLSGEAIELAWLKIKEAAIYSLPEKEKASAKPFDDVRVAKNRFLKGLKQLRYDNVPVKDLKLSEIKETITFLNITDGYYNKFLSYMSKIYTELIEYGCVETNPFKLYKKKKAVKKQREVLTDDEFINVMAFLKEYHYTFYRYSMIFHLSGARSTELMRVKKKDISISNQEYKVLIKKGNNYSEEIKVIMSDALPLWQEVLSECKSDEDYIFSTWLRPGSVPIAPRQISRKWNKFVKVQYNNKYEKNITADFYPLKHLFLDKLDALQLSSTINIAQIHASHKSPLITNSVYLVNKKKREREILKKIVVNKGCGL